MLQVARLSPKLLGDSKDLILAFLSREQENGAFRDRAGVPDLYYTVFGLECLRALSVELPTAAASAYLRTFGAGEQLDLVHLSSLARCWANIERDVPHADSIAAGLERFRTSDGGYGASGSGTLYGCFLAVGAYQDLRLELPNATGLIDCVRSLRAADGAFANQPGAPIGQTPATAAAVGLMRHLDEPIPSGVRDWLLHRQHESGGFLASPSAPIPDLLSTATALHALASLHAPIEKIREPALDFLDSLWTTRGGFLGSWADEVLDCEYTFYGLLALGYLSL
jgi:prenyltransferase beta subunit